MTDIIFILSFLTSIFLFGVLIGIKLRNSEIEHEEFENEKERFEEIQQNERLKKVVMEAIREFEK